MKAQVNQTRQVHVDAIPASYNEPDENSSAVSPSRIPLEKKSLTIQNQLMARWSRIAEIVLASGGIGCIAILCYLVYYYSWTAQRQFTSPSDMALYYVLPAFVAGLFFVSLRLKPIQKINIAILSCSLLLSFSAGEAFLSFMRPTPLPSMGLWGGHVEVYKTEITKLAKSFGVNFDTRTRLNVVVDLRQKGVDAVPVVPVRTSLEKRNDETLQPAITINGAQVLPLGGISNKVTVFCNEGGEYLIYVSDEYGFNNPKGIWKSRAVDVLAVGDSFAHGGCVAPRQSFVDLVRQEYPATINVAMGGHGPLAMLGTLKESLLLARPKVVLWFYFEHTQPAAFRRESKTPFLLRYLERDFSQKLLLRQREIDDALAGHIQKEMVKELSKQENRKNRQLAASLINTLKLTTWRQNLGLVHDGPDDTMLPLSDTEIALLGDILLQAKKSVADSGGRLYFVYLPAWERYGNPQLARKDRDHILQLVTTLGIPTIDVHQAFEAHNDSLSLFPFRRFAHYNEEGHRLVAETVLQSIQAKLKNGNPSLKHYDRSGGNLSH